MKVLITGGAGFIGSHLAEKYLDLGAEVYIIDNLSTGSLANIKPLQEDGDHAGRLHVKIDTIMKHNAMLELVGTCDVVIHMAAAVGVLYILDNPLQSIITNIQGTEKVLELCNKFKKKVMIASSSEVYGKHMHAPLVETDNIIFGPSTKFRWAYAASKLMDEFIALAYCRNRKLPVIIVRFFNTVGPRQTGRYGMVIPRFVNQALKNEPITVYGDGSQTRTFTHVKDVVEAIVKLVETPEALGEVINIGGMEEVSIKSLAERIKELTGSTSEVVFIPYESAFTKDFEDMLRRVPSMDKLRQLIGWQPTTTLDDILMSVIEYYRVRCIS